MRIFTNKNVIQKIVIILLIVILFNFLVPVRSEALIKEVGGSLLKTLLHMFQGLGDIINGMFNHFMLGTSEIIGSAMFDKDDPDFKANIQDPNSSIYYGDGPTDGAVEVVIDKDYMFEGQGWLFGDTIQIPNILYCPENIFANKIAVLDVNFLNPNKYEAVEYEEGATEANEDSQQAAESLTIRTEKDENGASKGESLRQIISGWYKAFRNIAVVGLLIVLVYIGIRTLLSSTSSDKAKYKESLQDWVVALCLVFFIHYIMAGVLMVTEKFTELVNESVNYNVYIDASAAKENDMFLPDDLESAKFKTTITGYVRFMAQSNDTGDCAAYTIMYIALVIFTIMFTITYIKRFLYVAFFTMIAPLVALSYPLDKIRDGKAQAFNLWFREYTMNVIIQPVHLILYSVFIGSAMSLAVNNPIYAIVAMGFLLPAEKFIKKLFGLDRAETEKGLGEIAGGALAMQGMGKLIGQFTGAGKSKTPTTSNKTSETNALNKKRGSNPEFESKSYADVFGGGQGGSQDQGGPRILTSGLDGVQQGAETGRNVGENVGSAGGQLVGGAIGSVVPGAGTAVGSQIGQGIGQIAGGTAGAVGGGIAGATAGTVSGAVQEGANNNMSADMLRGVDANYVNRNGIYVPRAVDYDLQQSSQPQEVQQSQQGSRLQQPHQPDIPIRDAQTYNGGNDYGDYQLGNQELTISRDRMNSALNPNRNRDLSISSTERRPGFRGVLDEAKDKSATVAKGLGGVARNRARKISGAITRPFNAENRAQTFKSIGKGAARLAGAGVVGAATATMGIAAGVASGDAGKALSYGAAAFSQGAHLGGSIGGRVGEVVGNTIQEDAQQFDLYTKDKTTRKREEQEKFDKVWKKDPKNYEYLRKQGHSHEEANRLLNSERYAKFREAGVTDIKTIDRAIKRADAKGYDDDRMIKLAQMATRESDNFGVTDQNALAERMEKEGIDKTTIKQTNEDLLYIKDLNEL